MDNLYFDNDKVVALKMLPVCDCGYIFRDGVRVEEVIGEVRGYKYPIHSINPPRCPNCNRLIECVSYNGKILGD